MPVKGFFAQFPPDLLAEAHRRWPTGSPSFTMASEDYFGLSGFPAILRREKDDVQVEEYLKVNTTTPLYREIMRLRHLLDLERNENKRHTAMAQKAHAALCEFCPSWDEDDGE